MYVRSSPTAFHSVNALTALLNAFEVMLFVAVNLNPAIAVMADGPRPEKITRGLSDLPHIRVLTVKPV